MSKQPRFDERDLAVLVAAQHEPNASLSAIARRAKSSTDTVRRALNRLTERGVLGGLTPLINLRPLMLQDIKVYFSWSAQALESREKILQYFVEEPRIAWVASLSGEFDAALLIPSTGPDEACSILEDAGRKFGGFMGRKSIVLRRSFTAYGRRHLAPNVIAPKPITVNSKISPADCDPAELAVLSVFSRSLGISSRAAATILNTTHSTVERRLRSLERKGIIGGWIYRINPAPLGLLTARLFISVNTLSEGQRAAIRSICDKTPRVIKLFENLGAWDYEIEIDGYSLEELERTRVTFAKQIGGNLERISQAQFVKLWKYHGYPFKI